MPQINITKKTRWECVRCGECCKGIIPSKNESLSIEKEGELVCKYLDTNPNNCVNYSKRPFICRIYPFVIDTDKILGSDGVARPQDAFLFENLKLHTECPGVGKGKRIYANKRLINEINDISYQFALDFKEAHQKGKDFSDFI